MELSTSVICAKVNIGISCRGASLTRSGSILEPVKFHRVGLISLVNVEEKGDAVLTADHKGQANLAQVVSLLLVVPALGQGAAVVCVNVGKKVGGVVKQHPQVNLVKLHHLFSQGHLELYHF